MVESQQVDSSQEDSALLSDAPIESSIEQSEQTEQSEQSEITDPFEAAYAEDEVDSDVDDEILYRSGDDTSFGFAKSSEEFDAVQREAVEKKGIVVPDLASKSVEVVEAPEHGFSNFSEAKRWAKDNIAKTYSSEETGGKGTVRISNTTIDKYFAASAVEKTIHQKIHKVHTHMKQQK